MGLKEKAVGVGGCASGGLSILGGANVCHSMCMSIATLLSTIGITISGMPLMFLQKVAIPFWIAAVIILLAMLAFHQRMQFSKKAMLANIGLIIAGTPFRALSAFQMYFWIVGGALVVGSIAWALCGQKAKHNIYKSTASARKRGNGR